MDFVRASKFLTLLLRHKPETVGLVLDENGWATIDDLVRLTATSEIAFTRDVIESLVATSDKQRFKVSDDGLRVRANQGHSIDVDLQLAAQEPPIELYHGTSVAALAAIRADGLRPMSRQHVHLSADQETAKRVGARHGKPVVLTVRAHAMHGAGHAFYVSANGVWLTESVGSEWIDFPDA